MSAAVNELVRRGAATRSERKPFVQRTSSAHALIDLTTYSEVLDLIEGPDHK
ncbi:MAG: hypothetical protein ACT4PP_00520 [Sporichthyaceae bacterium]